MNLLFDADGTLYDFKATENISLGKVFEHYGIDYSSENIDLYHEKNSHLWDLYEKGLINQDMISWKRFEDFFSALGLGYDAKEAGELYTDYLASNGIMIDGAIELLEKLYGRHNLYIITNGIAKTQHGRIDGTGTGKYFKRLFISTEMGTQKPEKAFFDIVMGEENLDRKRTIVIGDSEKSDIKGALNAGLKNIFISFKGDESPLADYSVSSYDELLEYIDKLDLEY